MLGWARMMKALPENPTLSSVIPECALEFCRTERLLIKRNMFVTEVLHVCFNVQLALLKDNILLLLWTCVVF